ncbi:MAG: NAD(P)/FAD-dependent oxidoreductase [Bacteroidetes bacterium]|nr:NAD(P)/FAD-dependent oxidoreductase [Bacteroidota bacterium]
MRIAIIGFGAAAIGFIEKMKSSGHEIHVFEKSRDIYSTSISGIRADGKLFVSKEMGGELDVDLTLQKMLVDFWISKTGNGEYERGSSFKNPRYYKEFYERGFQPVISDFYHLGTDQLKKVLFNIFEEYRAFTDIHIHFESPVTDIEVKGKKVHIDNYGRFDKVIVAVGRSGHKLIKAMIRKYSQLVLDSTRVDIGVRFELPDHIVEDLNREMYEFKVKYKSKTGYMVRTFCNNPSGFVVTEHYGDFTTVNGHARIKGESKNTNFAILTTVQLTEPFNDPIGYGSNIAKMSNILGGDRVILQTYSHFVDSKRTKNLYRVKPTLPEDKYILGDINLAYPRRIIESIIDFAENLNKVIPGITHPDNLVYAPEIKFYSNTLNNHEFGNLKFIGDCSGFTRSIIYATAHGYLMAEEILGE